MRYWTGRDVVALILAGAIGISVAAPLVIGSFRGVPLSQQAADLLAVVQGAALGAIATYLGGSTRRADPENGADTTHSTSS